MENNISSPEQAIRALMKAKQKSVPVRVNVSFSGAVLSFEGALIGADLECIQVERVLNGGSIAMFRCAYVHLFDFVGMFEENAVTFTLALTMVKKGTFNQADAPRISLNAGWQDTPELPTHVN